VPAHNTDRKSHGDCALQHLVLEGFGEATLAAEGDYGFRQEHGQFEVWICASCGLTEWYSVNVNQALSLLCQNPSSGVSYVDGDTQPPTVDESSPSS
jgi:hypothetical protein